jgi:hypothetical protein
MLLNENIKELSRFIDGKQIDTAPTWSDVSHPTDCICVWDEFAGEELPKETESANTFDELTEYVLSKSREFAITVEL